MEKMDRKSRERVMESLSLFEQDLMKNTILFLLDKNGPSYSSVLENPRYARLDIQAT